MMVAAPLFTHFSQASMLFDISCENIFALPIVIALAACPFPIKKCAKTSVFYEKTVKIRWRMGAMPSDPLVSVGWGFHPQTPDCAPFFCQILGAPL